MKKSIGFAIGCLIALSGCAGQSPLVDLAEDMDLLKDNPFSERWQQYAAEGLEHADTMGLNAVELAQAKACSEAIIAVGKQKKELISRYQQHLLELDARANAGFNPIIIAQDLKWGKDPEAMLKADKAEIVGLGEYLLNSCRNLFPTDKAVNLARKVFGGGL